jgi:hypothetical protein
LVITPSRLEAVESATNPVTLLRDLGIVKRFLWVTGGVMGEVVVRTLQNEPVDASRTSIAP